MIRITVRLAIEPVFMLCCDIFYFSNKLWEQTRSIKNEEQKHEKDTWEVNEYTRKAQKNKAKKLT